MTSARTRPDGRRTDAILSTCRPPRANDNRTPADGKTIARTSSAPFVVVASGKTVASGIGSASVRTCASGIIGAERGPAGFLQSRSTSAMAVAAKATTIAVMTIA
jgi:hypothetical protein